MNIIYSDRELAVIIKPVGMDSEHQVPAAIITAQVMSSRNSFQ